MNIYHSDLTTEAVIKYYIIRVSGEVDLVWTAVGVGLEITWRSLPRQKEKSAVSEVVLLELENSTSIIVNIKERRSRPLICLT